MSLESLISLTESYSLTNEEASSTCDIQTGDDYIIIQKTPTTCSSNLGSITFRVQATKGGIEVTSLYEFSINNGQSWNSSPLFSGLPLGDYYCKVRLQSDPTCIGSYQFNPVSIVLDDLNPPFITDIEVQNTSDCVNDDDGEIDIWVDADTDVEFSIDNGQSWTDPVPYGFESFYFLSPGTYTVIVRNVNDDCKRDEAQVTVESGCVIPCSNTNLNLLVSEHQPATAGNNDGILAVEISGGLAPYTLQIGSTTYAVNEEGEQLYTDLGEGTYTIMVSDSEGCSQTTQGIITENTQQSQLQDWCGVTVTEDDINAYESYLEGISSTAGGPFDDNPLIPLNIIIVYDDEGGTLGGQLGVEELTVQLEEAHRIFDGIMSFYVCGITTLNNTNLSNLQVTAQDETEIDQLYNLSHADDAINIYWVNSITIQGAPAGGIARFPFGGQNNNFIASTDNGLIETIAHEIGHYFGLYHTFEGGPIRQHPSVEAVFGCESAGDRICDTPIDPGTSICDPNCTIPGCFVSQEHLLPNQEPFMATPDCYNVMSYYFLQPKSFTDGQVDKMLEVLNNDPARNFLLDATPNCDPPTILPGFGYVETPKIENVFGAPPSLSFAPFIDVRVTSNVSNTNCATRTDPFYGRYRLFHSQASCQAVIPVSIFGSDLDVKVLPEQSDPNPTNNLMAPLNGVSVLDVIKIRKHVLNFELLDNPFSKIAADVDNSGSISVLDIIKINNLILNQISEFADVGSWRYIPQYYLENPAFNSAFYNNPFDNVLTVWNGPGGPRSYSSANSYMNELDLNLLNPDVSLTTTWSFIGVKSGDVDFSASIIDPVLPNGFATPGSFENSFGTNAPKFWNEISLRTEPSIGKDFRCLKKGQTAIVDVKLTSDEDIVGYQFGVQFDIRKVQVSGFKSGNAHRFSYQYLLLSLENVPLFWGLLDRPKKIRRRCIQRTLG